MNNIQSDILQQHPIATTNTTQLLCSSTYTTLGLMWNNSNMLKTKQKLYDLYADAYAS